MKRVFILGAGASDHAGIPLGNKIIEEYINETKFLNVDVEKKEIVNRPIENNLLINHPTLHRILLHQPCLDIDTNKISLDQLLDYNWPKLQDLLTFYDFASKRQEQFTYGLHEENEILRQDIIDFIIRIIKQSVSSEYTPEYLLFSSKLTLEDTVISFNYDTLIDNSIRKNFGMLNFGFIPKVKEYHPKAILELSKELEVDKSNFNPQFGDKAPLLIKPHGSFNLLYCPQCYEIYYKFGDRKREFGLPSFEPTECDDSGYLEEHILPLSYYKNFSNPLVSSAWVSIVRELSKAEEVYFIGYSIPDEDIQAKYFFIKGITRPFPDPKIILVNPSATNNSGLVNKFKRLFGKIKIIGGEKGKFEKFVYEL